MVQTIRDDASYNYSHSHREKQIKLLRDSEKVAILKLESDFLQNWADFFLLLADSLATNLVTSEHVDKKWKVKLLKSCQTIIDEAQRSIKSKAVAKLEISSNMGTQAIVRFLSVYC